MSAKNSTSTNSELEALVPVAVHLIQTAQRIQGSSTPKQDQIYRPFVPPSDISSVISGSDVSDDVTPRKRSGNSRSENQTMAEGRPTTSTSCILRKRSASTPVQQSKLESVVAERLTLPSIRMSLSSAFSKLHVSNSDNSGNSPEYLEPPAKKYKVACKGQDWTAFKPQHKDGIYKHILNQPNDTLAEAKEWVQLYKEDAAHAIINLIQFLADICGYQNFDVCSVFNYQQENYIELRDFMEEHPPKYQQKTGKYLMKAASKWGKHSQTVIFDFIRNFLEIVNTTEILFDRILLKHLLGVVMIFICSRNRSMHHTGIVVLVQMYTVFLEIHENMKKKIESYRRTTKVQDNTEDQLNVTVQYESLVYEVLKKLQNIIEQHCHIDDAALDTMEVTIVEEMFKWFEINPSLISSTKYFSSLMKFVEDSSKKVRSAALIVCHKIVKDNTMDNYMNPLMKKFVEVVVGRVYDIDYGIAACAVSICTDLLRKYRDAIPVLSRDRIMMLVYCENQQLATAAGAVLNEVLHRYCTADEEENSVIFITHLIAFSYLEEQNYVPLLVEAMLPWCPQLSDWNTMIGLLLQGDLEYKEETKLIDIMSHAVQQTVTGKSKINRGKSSQGQPKIQNIRKTSCIFLTKLYQLLKKYSTDSKSVQLLAEILLVIDYTDISFNKYVTDVLNIIKVLQSCFVKNSNKELLETISIVLAKLCDELSVFKSRATGLVAVLKEAVVNALHGSLEKLNQTEELSEDNLSKIEATTLKLAVLFIHHDLTELWEDNLTDWLNIYELVTPKSTKSIITCGYWNVIWKLRKIIANSSKTQPSENLKQSISHLKSICDKYIELCFHFLKDAEHFLISSEAFECICNVYMAFKKDLKNPIKSNPVLKELLPHAPQQNELALLMSFAQKLLFEEKNKSCLKLRRIHLGNILNLAFLQVISLQELNNVYKYYHLHNDDYGDIFRDSLQHIRANDVLLLVGVVLHSLVRLFTDTDLTLTEARDNLRALAKQFQMFVAHSPEEVKLILQMGIKYAIFSESRYTFLYYLKYFIATLSANNRKLMLEFFTAKVSNLHTSNQVFIDFKSYLKNGITAERAARRRSLTSATTDLDSEEEYIEENTNTDASSFAEEYTIDDMQ